MTKHLCTCLCSHRATPESLTALGFPVRKVVKGCFGTLVVEVEGMPFEKARHEAWAAGAIRLCTRDRGGDGMTDAPVPGSKSIKTRSIPNVDTDRLHRRLSALRDLFAGGYKPEKHDDGRATFRARVRETINVERELARRGESFQPVTDGRHLENI